jgi:hypothetical protein
MRLFNPNSGVEFETSSDDELHVQVYLDAGWQKAPEPERRPGYEPEPTRYEPVKAEPVKKTASKRTSKDEDR